MDDLITGVAQVHLEDHRPGEGLLYANERVEFIDNLIGYNLSLPAWLRVKCTDALRDTVAIGVQVVVGIGRVLKNFAVSRRFAHPYGAEKIQMN